MVWAVRVAASLPSLIAPETSGQRPCAPTGRTFGAAHPAVSRAITMRDEPTVRGELEVSPTQASTFLDQSGTRGAAVS